MTEDAAGTQLADGDIEEIKAQVDNLLQLNQQREQMLAEKYQVGLDPLNFVHARISAITQALLDERGQLRLEVLTQTVISNMLDSALNQAEAQKTRSTLLEGVPGLDPRVHQQQVPFLGS
jgi:hypothetical protein